MPATKLPGTQEGIKAGDRTSSELHHIGEARYIEGLLLLLLLVAPFEGTTKSERKRLVGQGNEDRLG